MTLKKTFNGTWHVPPGQAQIDAFVLAALDGHDAGVREYIKLYGSQILEAQDKDKFTAMTCAAKNGHLPVLEALVFFGVDVNGPDGIGNLPLTRSSYFGQTDCVKFLLNHGALVTKKDKRLRTPLMYAAWQNEVDVIRLLLEKGADLALNEKDEGGLTALIHAADKSRSEAVEELLKHNPLLEVKDNLDNTALGYAAFRGDLKTVQVLIRKGASLETKSARKTPLEWAQERDEPEIVAYIKRVLAVREYQAHKKRMADEQQLLKDTSPATLRPLPVKPLLKINPKVTR